MIQQVTCQQCGSPIKGRVDKKFCDDNCRNTWHNLHNKENNHVVRMINAGLKRNRRILEILNPTGTSRVSKNELLKRGFDFNLHTSMFKSNAGKTYFFCYEYGYTPLANDMYMLVIHSHYKTQIAG